MQYFDSLNVSMMSERAKAEAIRSGYAFVSVPPYRPTRSAPRDQGTDGRTYGGACELVHIPDGSRREVGRMVAHYIDRVQRAVSRDANAADLLLCPGCYMVVIVNAAVHLAEHNGQDLRELGASLASAFQQIAETGELPPALFEEIEVKPQSWTLSPKAWANV